MKSRNWGFLMTAKNDRQIKVLSPEEARKIAAGEVIDRPAALVRELLDNAIDAGAKNIDVHIEEGGISLTEVIDDGEGMSREDLSVCHLTHATSKIRSLDDLAKISSLGFRGEALAAAAAVSILQILSSRDGKEAWKLKTGPGEKNKTILEMSSRTMGTTVSSSSLYDSIPARKKFLKRPGSEGAACLQIFYEKAMAFPSISFKFFQDKKLKAFLPACNSLRERFAKIHLNEGELNFLNEIYATGDKIKITILAGGAELSRRDRRLQFVFANKRRIQDYSLLQALEYGLGAWFPGGTHPLGAIFIEIDPSLADFNIHPAKREVRFRDTSFIHHLVSSTLTDFCKRKVIHSQNEDPIKQDMPDVSFAVSGSTVQESLAFTLAEEAAEAEMPYITEDKEKARYLGTLFELFILVEKGDKLFIVDQHAAHEGILYNSFLKEPIAKQELLIPIVFTTESAEEDNFLKEKQDELLRLGVKIKKEDSEWQIEELPGGWRLSDTETVKEILNLSKAGKNFALHWMISLSCWAAVKDGDYLDADKALSLAEEALKLPSDHCPHGRPLWYEISREELLRAVKRV